MRRSCCRCVVVVVVVPVCGNRSKQTSKQANKQTNNKMDGLLVFARVVHTWFSLRSLACCGLVVLNRSSFVAYYYYYYTTPLLLLYLLFLVSTYYTQPLDTLLTFANLSAIFYFPSNDDYKQQASCW